MTQQRIGILFQVNGSPLPAAIKRAISQFKKSEHTKGLIPAEVHFSPSDLEGLEVYVDDRIDPGFIRVTTRPIISELDLEKACFASEVRVEVERLTA